ncbi:hypothetical protein PYDG_00011 [Pseudoalteromonas phage pYD6-A]|uniref:Uncharacterized protein n=1 Tax=Pseudoalteromonas phage pYD6-A TaxID=754052 RepID=M4SNC4_9CAUD|nr:hypothetical protein PYDG_00011 [Pseudoalteromonas phage pYD6-A]AGH57543.1 hypothetical protein PYDG_00011 [Pseudoalteromonas phage pYD6-A]
MAKYIITEWVTDKTEAVRSVHDPETMRADWLDRADDELYTALRLGCNMTNMLDIYKRDIRTELAVVDSVEEAIKYEKALRLLN